VCVWSVHHYNAAQWVRIMRHSMCICLLLHADEEHSFPHHHHHQQLFSFHGLLYLFREITHSRYITLVNSSNLQSCSLLLLLFLLFSWPLCLPFSLRALELALALMSTSSSLVDGTRTVSGLSIPSCCMRTLANTQSQIPAVKATSPPAYVPISPA
jgi:hypothetical protein